MSEEKKPTRRTRKKPEDKAIIKPEFPAYYSKGTLPEQTRPTGRRPSGYAEANSFLNYSGNLSGRDEYTTKDFDYFRKSGVKPVTRPDIINKCFELYKNSGLVRQLIDLQVDFTCYGMRVCHRNKNTQKLLRRWFDAIKGNSINERLVHGLYTAGVSIIKRDVAPLSRSEEKDMRATAARPKIPTSYNFINPAVVDCTNPELATITGSKNYKVVLPQINLTEFKKTLAYKNLSEQRKKEFDQGYIDLDMKDTIIVHFKKNDWQIWADPILFSIFHDIDMIQRLELADKTVLDGAISKVRVFKIGNLEHEFYPTEDAFDRLNELLQANGNGSTTDIIWGPDLEIEETTTDGFNFLGKEKFVPYIEKIYMSMGVPILSGSSRGTAQTGTLSLNSLIQRLEYGRQKLRDFWNAELAIMKKEMNFRHDAIIEFDYPNLSDENAYKALLIQLADRNLISDEALDYAFKLDPDMERHRISQEESDRDSGDRVRKVTPYNEGDFEKIILKNLAIKGIIDPSDLNLDVKIIEDKMEGQPFSGRPRNSRDSEPRKKKAFKAKGHVWVEESITSISELIKPFILKTYGRRNLRELTFEETKIYEDMRISILFNLDTSKIIDQDSIAEALSKPVSLLMETYRSVCEETAAEIKRPLTLENKNTIASLIYNENIPE